VAPHGRSNTVMKLDWKQRRLVRTALIFGAATAVELARWSGMNRMAIYRVAGFRHRPMLAYRGCWGERTWRWSLDARSAGRKRWNAGKRLGTTWG
jgi:hypothetical protein